MASRDDYGSVLVWRRQLAASYMDLNRETSWPAVADAGLRKMACASGHDLGLPTSLEIIGYPIDQPYTTAKNAPALMQGVLKCLGKYWKDAELS
jgi:hypothetical protein